MLKISLFFLDRRQKAVGRMGPSSIVKSFNIFKKRKIKIFQRGKNPPVQFLLFQIFEKGFRYGIIVGMAFGGKRLDTASVVKSLAEIL